MYKYLIAGDHYVAVPVHSDLNWNEFNDYMRTQYKKIHPKGKDIVWKCGISGMEVINPRVTTPDDYADFGPYFIGIKL